MSVEMTLQEAELLIAVLTFAEGVALAEAPAITAALRDLWAWRSALMGQYVLARLNEAQKTPA